MLHTETVETGTLALIKQLSQDPVFKEFSLVGGTALSLQLGHRKSIDIDFFSSKPFDAKALGDYLKDHYQAEDIRPFANFLFSKLQGIKTDIIAHQYPWVDPVKEIDGIRMASTKEIGAMKLHAIVRSGERLKDFIDMHFLLEKHSLEQLTNAYAAKYKDSNPSIVRNALLYHEEIDFGGLVELVNRALNWADVAKRLRMAVVKPEKVFTSAQIGSVVDQNQQAEARKQNKGRRR